LGRRNHGPTLKANLKLTTVRGELTLQNYFENALDNADLLPSAKRQPGSSTIFSGAAGGTL
jgi:hypothetical protein